MHQYYIPSLSVHLTSAQAIFDELVNLVDPGIEPYRPKKGYPNVIMAVGLQACRNLLFGFRSYPVLGKWQDYYVYKISCTLSEARIQIFYRLR